MNRPMHASRPIAPHRRTLLAALAGTALAPLASARAQAFPDQPVRVILPMAAGGGADIAMRAMSSQLNALWGVNVLVDNRAGGTGSIGLEVGKRSRPDGHTVVLCTATHAALQALGRSLPYDLLTDFAPVTQVTAAPYVLVLHPSVKADSVAELVALSKASPDGLTYASAGLGSMQHLAGAMLSTLAGANLLHVPYKGGGPAMADVLAGQVSMVFATPQEAMQQVPTGRLRPLAVTGRTRLPAFPDLPTMLELGFDGYEVTQWYGILAPKDTPADRVAKLSQDIGATARSPAMTKRLSGEGLEVLTSTPDEFAAHLRAEIVRFRKVAALARLKFE